MANLIWIEVGVAALITLVMFASTLLFKAEHMAPSVTDVRIGAGLQGAILGALVGFVLVPVRMAYFGDGAGLRSMPSPAAATGLLAILVFVVVVRRGLLARAPVIGRYMRAYRRALLRWQIGNAEKAIARIEAIEARSRR